MTKKMNYVKMEIRINTIKEWKEEVNETQKKAKKEEVNETQKKAKLDVECMYVDANHYD